MKERSGVQKRLRRTPPQLEPLFLSSINSLTFLFSFPTLESELPSSSFQLPTPKPHRTRPNQKSKMEAPLSSPSLNGPSQTQHSYFSQPTSSSTSSASSGPTSAPQQKPVAQPPPQQQRQDTSPFLRDFNLVAEAAKRAQMAVLMRDMEGVAISP